MGMAIGMAQWVVDSSVPPDRASVETRAGSVPDRPEAKL
jgi:hypothetical protein